MSRITDDLNKRTRQLENQKLEKGEELVQNSQYQNQIQAINGERMKNLAIERQDAQIQGQGLETMAMSGAMATQGGSDGVTGEMVSPQTQATLGKYGLVGQPRIQRQSHRDVQVKPNNIVINNTYNTTTTNNVSGGGPVQGRPVQISAAATTEAKSQGRFKAWLENAFAQQKEANAKRTKEYEKREWSLSKSVNKMLRKMEDSTRSIGRALDPRGIGTTIGSQLKTLMWLFGIHFLAKNWDKILDVGASIFKGIVGILDWIGLGPNANKLRSEGRGIRGDLIYFLTGDRKKATDGKTTLLSVISDIFKSFGDHLKTWFEKQMALRGAAIKAVKFPDLKLGENSGSAWGLDAMFGRIVAALGSTLGKVMSGVTTYLGDILTAIVNPEAGASRGVDRAIERQANFSSEAARRREGLNEFKSVGDNTMRGDYALEAKNDQGKKSYALLGNALDVNGKLTGSAASTISQSRDILGAYNDTRDYGAIDISRVYQGIKRLQETANSKGSVILDEEFVNRMFGPQATQDSRFERVKMKYVKVENNADYMNRQHQYMMTDTGWATAGDIAGFAGETAGWAIPGIQALKGAKALNVAGKLTTARALGKAGKGALIGELSHGLLGDAARGIVGWGASFAEDDNHLELVPAEDPRPAATVDGHQTGIVTYYRAKPEVLEDLMRTFDPEGKGDRELIIGNIEKHMVQQAGGKEYVDHRWNMLGKLGFAKQRVTDVSEQLGKLHELRNISASYDRRLENDKWSQYKTTWGNNLSHIGNQAIGILNTGWNYARSFIDDTFSARNATFAYDVPPIQPSEQYAQFNVSAAVDTLHRNASIRYSDEGAFGKDPNQPSGTCAKHTRMAIAAGLGIPDTRPIMGYPASAFQYAGTLGSVGFAPLNWSNYTPQAGDVVVEPRQEGHPHGHIAMYDGHQWISDFAQRDIWGGSTFRKNKKGVVFRHISLMKPDDVPALGIESGTVQQDDRYSSGLSFSGSISIGDTGFSGSLAGGTTGTYSGGYSGSTYAGPIQYTTREDRGRWTAEHSLAWKKVLQDRGYNEEDSTRLAGFFAAQDGFESAMGTNRGARELNNFGGMMSGGKQITYSSREEYMNAKLDMMQKKFGNALKATNLMDYIETLGRTEMNGGYAYYVPEGGKSLAQTIREYQAGAASYAASANKYGQGAIAVDYSNPLFAKVESGGDVEEEDLINYRFGELTPEELQKKLSDMRSIEQAATLWTNTDVPSSIFNRYEDFEKLWLSQKTDEDREAMRRGILDAQQYHDRLGQAEVFTSDKSVKNWMRNLSHEGFNEHQRGTRGVWGHHEFDARVKKEGEEAYQNIYKDILEGKKGAEYTNKLGAAVLFSEYRELNGQLEELNKNLSKNPRNQDLIVQRNDVSQKMAKYESAASNYMFEVSKETDPTKRQFIYSKNKEIAEIGGEIIGVHTKKKALEKKYNDLLRKLSWEGASEEEIFKVKENFLAELGVLNDEEKALQEKLASISSKLTEEQNKFLEETTKAIELSKKENEQLVDEFGKLIEAGKTSVDAINEMIKKYGEQVLERMRQKLMETDEWFKTHAIEQSDFDPNRDVSKYIVSDEEYKKNPYIMMTPEQSINRAVERGETTRHLQQAGMVPGTEVKGLDEAKKLQSKRNLESWGFSLTGNKKPLFPEHTYSVSAEGTGRTFTDYREDTQELTDPILISIRESERKKRGNSKAIGGWTPDDSATAPYHIVNGKWEYGTAQGSRFGYLEGGDVTFHGGEYVIPKYMTQIPAVRADINKWEQYRTSTIAGQKVGGGLVKEPVDYSAMMVAHQEATNELLSLIARTNSSGFNKVADVTAATATPPVITPPSTRTFNYK